MKVTALKEKNANQKQQSDAVIQSLNEHIQQLDGKQSAKSKQTTEMIRLRCMVGI